MRGLSLLAVPFAALAAAVLPGCGGGGGGGPAHLAVTMHDTPVDEAEAVWVTIDRVDVMRDDAGTEVTETLVSTPAQYDLLVLQNGVEAVLGGGSFPAGDYTSIRLIVGTNTEEEAETLPADQLKNYIVIDGVAHPMVVPSGAQTGIKLNHEWTMAAGGSVVLTLDFDVRKSVTQRGHQDLYNLRPTIKLTAAPGLVTGGSVSGTVTNADASPLAVGTVVSAQKAGVEMGHANPDALTGTYTIAGLATDTYDLIVSSPGHAFATEAGVAVTDGADSPGHDFVLDASDVGELMGFVDPVPTTAVMTVLWNGFLVGTASADPATGAYSFPGLPAGFYTIRGTTVNGTVEVTDNEVSGGGVTEVDFTVP
jgi:hypothetical protein